MKILTYNIHKGMDANNVLKLGKMIDYFKENNFDIICLQEVLNHQFLKIKKDLKYDGVFATNVNKPTILFGVCTLSKYPINYSSHVFLTSKKEQRGFLNIETKIDDLKLNVINTHLGLDKEERYTQIDEILDYTNRLTGKNILCGDFNEKNLNISKFNDASVVLNLNCIPTFGKLWARIDYIFVDKRLDIKDYSVDKINLSDHYPVISKIY